ncbi:MAG: polyprenyl synthetase family protein [Gammaproteobacteria bacterium]|nr:polyprenyl synthetase family protein [Gammaproteobacteria bacterium]
MTRIDPEDTHFPTRMPDYVSRVERCMDAALPTEHQIPERLHSAMRYAAMSGGKRIRPLLIYATGECLDIAPERLDVPATAIEFIHAFSLVHDDLPAMDDDDLRRGRPTVHRQFDEATAILAADALQPLAFQVIATAEQLTDAEARQLIKIIAGACGSLGMTGGQAIDLESEGRELSVDELANMHGLKTGALISASVMSACCLAPALHGSSFDAMDRFSRDIGLAFQIRDDILDVEGETAVIGKPSGSDVAREKATWPALFGVDESKRRCRELHESANSALDEFGIAAEPMRYLAGLIVERVQ